MNGLGCGGVEPLLTVLTFVRASIRVDVFVILEMGQDGEALGTVTKGQKIR